MKVPPSEAFWVKPKAKPREFILKVDNIVPLWRSVIPNNLNLSLFSKGFYNLKCLLKLI